MAAPPHRLEIRKYPNRRFYDATRSRHVTLPELHELVCGGHVLRINDSTSGQDITNLVLTQILIERDAEKLALFPSEVLHQVIRTQATMMGTVLEQFMKQMVDAQRSSQDQWMRFLQNTLGFAMPPATTSAYDWTQAMMQPFRAAPAPTPPAAAAAAEPTMDEAARAAELAEVRRQMEQLSRRVEELSESARDPDA